MIIELEQATNKSLAGNKAVQLAKLLKSIKNIPKGFVVPHNENNHQVIINYIKKNCSSRKLYAVRSSSNVEDSGDYSFAGMFDTFLGVRKEELLQKILEVKKSSSSSRINALKEKIGLDKEVQVSVLVQEMVNSQVSGICFTANPTTGKTNEIFIEAGIGLGEFVVSNEITPDSYIVNKKSNSIKKKTISSQHKALFLDKPPIEKAILVHTQKISNDLILRLCKEAKTIEEKLGFVADIEWAVNEKGELLILQARPITFAN